MGFGCRAGQSVAQWPKCSASSVLGIMIAMTTLAMFCFAKIDINTDILDIIIACMI